VSIANNDAEQNPYTFVVQGSTPLPGAALAFDGTDDYVAIPALNLNTNSVTFEAWIYPDGTQNPFTGLMEVRGNDNNLGLLLRNNNELGYLWGNTYWDFASNLTVPSNQWSHVALVVEPTKATLYLNGVAATNSAAHPVKAFDTPLDLGTDRPSPGRQFKGRMDEVRVWNRALSAGEIAADSNCELGSTPGGLVARYNFNQGMAAADNSSVTSLTDGSGNSRHGALTGFALSGSTSNWVAPGSPASGVACLDRPDIAVQGNGAAIANGDTTPSSADGTAFGPLSTGKLLTRTFTIGNVGTAALTGVAVTVNGNSAFSLSTPPAATVSPNGSSSFVITFDPDALGEVTATISIKRSSRLCWMPSPTCRPTWGSKAALVPSCSMTQPWMMATPTPIRRASP